jgi:4-hydroxy-2-oxoheptanedioate aldolase
MEPSPADRQPRLNRLRALWAEGRFALGAIATIPSAQVVQVLAASGLDFLLIDMEHGPVGPAEAHTMIAATAGTPPVPLARVAATTHANVPLDLGAMGVCFPLVSTRADAPLRWGLPMRDYQDRADDEVLAIATIEHVAALDAIDEVVSTPGLDLAFIGPGDLATSMGHRGRAEHPDVQAAMLRFEEAIRPSPVVMGGVAPTPEQANAMAARGYRALAVGFDWSLLQRGCAAAIEGITR